MSLLAHTVVIYCHETIDVVNEHWVPRKFTGQILMKERPKRKETNRKK